MSFAPLGPEDVPEDWTPNFHDDRKVSIICDEEQDGLQCGNGVDLLVVDNHPDPDGLYWNPKTRAAVVFLGWKVTPDNDYCPEHANKSAEETDSGVRAWQRVVSQRNSKALTNA